MFRNRLKKKHFKKRILGQRLRLWDVEFLKKKHLSMKEGFRMERDRIKEMYIGAETRLQEEKKKEDPDKTICDNMQKLMEKYKPDLEHLEKQMEAIDSQVEGPEGFNEVIENLHSAIELREEYRKEL